MTKVSIAAGKLLLEVEGLDKLWALRSHLSIPLEHIIRVYSDPTIAEGWLHGIRVGGTNLPGVITAGTFYQHGDWIFWDVHHHENTIVIELRHEHYARLIIEVERPQETIDMIQRNLITA